VPVQIRFSETYAKILSDFSDRVDAVYIHNVSGQDQSAGRYKDLFPTAAMAAKLRVFTEPSELPRRLGSPMEASDDQKASQPGQAQ
jgi:hypothetical protein